jgi:hypothetical protein
MTPSNGKVSDSSAATGLHFADSCVNRRENPTLTKRRYSHALRTSARYVRIAISENNHGWAPKINLLRKLPSSFQ